MLLALDTSTRAGSVAVWQGGALFAHRALEPTARHGASLAAAVADLGLDLAALEAFAVTIGPGSFTGLRIAVAFIKGLALVYPRPVLALSTLEVLAAGVLDLGPRGVSAAPEGREVSAVRDDQLLLPLLDARRGEVYAGLYRVRGGALDPEPVLREGVFPLVSLRSRIEEARAGREVLAVGDGLALDWGETPPWIAVDAARASPDARVLARLAAERWQRGERGRDAAEIEPTYLMSPPGGEGLSVSIPSG